MSKTHKNITVDVDLWDNLAKIYPNQLSSKINMFLHSLYNTTKSNSNGFALAELNNKLIKIDEQITKLNSEKQNITENIEFIKLKIKEKEEEKLKKDKENAEKMKTCDMCGCIEEKEKLHISEKGKLCNSCYMTGDIETLKKFLGGKDQ